MTPDIPEPPPRQGPGQRPGQEADTSQLGALSLRVLDSISAMVAYWDTNQLCRFANQAYLQWFGKSREQLLGTSMKELLGPLYEKNLPHILGALRGEQQIFERAIPTPSGIIRHSIATYTPDIIDGTVRGFFVHVADVSPLKAAQEETQKAQRAAEEAARAKSDFLASMSHEIRTPMNAVLGLARLLGHTPLNPLQAEYLRKLAAAGRSLLSIIDDILTFSKIEAGKLTLAPREFSLDQLLEDLASILAATAEEKDLEIVLCLAPDVPRSLVGDVGRIKQVLINLTRNAVKFSERGEIIVEVSREEVLAGGAVRLRFSVRDTGIGIPADQLERIFEPFAQADNSATRSYGGTGLGLPISRKLVRTLGGDLYVQSTPGRGSTFWFTIPLGVATTPVARDSGSVELPESLRVLALCTSPLITRFLRDTCSAFGWEFAVVADAASATAALKQAAAARSPFDVVFVNWALRDPQGLELARALRALPDSIQPLLVFLVQSQTRPALDTALGGLTIDQIIEKPVTASGLYRTVARALLRRGPAPAQPQPTEPPTAKRLRGLRILVVDDNPIVLEVTTALLNHEGGVLTAVSGGRAALELLGNGPPPFDVVLLDIQMPGMDGYQTACEIRRRPSLAKLPVIAVSAGVLWEERDRCRAAGMNGFLSKPLDVEEAILLIGSLTAHALPNAAELAHGDGEPADDVRFDLSASLGSAGSDAAALARLLVLFLEENAAMQSSTRAGMERGDLEGTAKALHRLRGTAAVLGAGRLARACQALELRLRAGEAACAQAEVQEYEAALREVLEAARSFLRRRA